MVAKSGDANNIWREDNCMVAVISMHAHNHKVSLFDYYVFAVLLYLNKPTSTCVMNVCYLQL